MKVNYYNFNWWLYKKGYIDNQKFIKNRKFIKTLLSEVGEII